MKCGSEWKWTIHIAAWIFHHTPSIKLSDVYRPSKLYKRYHEVHKPVHIWRVMHSAFSLEMYLHILPTIRRVVCLSEQARSFVHSLLLNIFTTSVDQKYLTRRFILLCRVAGECCRWQYSEHQHNTAHIHVDKWKQQTKQKRYGAMIYNTIK